MTRPRPSQDTEVDRAHPFLLAQGVLIGLVRFAPEPGGAHRVPARHRGYNDLKKVMSWFLCVAESAR